MEVFRTTVPGDGVIHQFATRGGQRFGLVIDETGRRTLVVYDPADPDVPQQSIVLEQDEADQVAEILHSRPVLDRLAELERRLAELTARSSRAT